MQGEYAIPIGSTFLRLSRYAAAFLGWAILGGATPAAAHPHIFIEHSLTVLFDKSALSGVRVTWIFDELYSTMLRADYTDKPNGPLSKADVKNLEQHAFGNLASVHYFTSIKLNGTPASVDKVKDFTARADKDRMIYEFTVPLSADGKTGQNTLEMLMFDPEYYVDFQAAATDPVKVVGGAPLQAECNSVGDKRETIGFGMADVDELVCTYTVKG